jgi:hypothetical protein
MHDSGWLIFAFKTEMEMLDILGGGPHYMFGRPLILKVMPDFFDFQATNMIKMPTWLRFLNLPLRCWTSIYLSKLTGMIGKPIHCDDPTANMTPLSYARVLIEVDLLLDPPTFVNVVLPNGTSLSQQVMYEFLPCFCKRCWVLGHSVSTCNKEASSKRKNQPHDALTYSGNSSPSAETAAVEKQQPFSAVPPTDPPVNLMFTEVVTAGETRPTSPGRKRTKIAEAEHSGSKQSTTPKVVHISEEGDAADVEPPKR